MSGGLKTRLKTGIPENVSNGRGRPEQFYFLSEQHVRQEPMKAVQVLEDAAREFKEIYATGVVEVAVLVYVVPTLRSGISRKLP